MATHLKSRFIFLDLETTGLDCDSDQITEAAWVTDDGVERQMFVRHSKLPNDWVIHHTDYVTRILPAEKVHCLEMIYELQKDVARLHLVGEVYLVGACPAFDDRFLRKVLGAFGHDTPYNYHVIDIEAVVMGAFKLRYVPKLKEIRTILGIDGANAAPHTALEDAKEVKLIWDTLIEKGLL